MSVSFSALTLLVGRQKEHQFWPVDKPAATIHKV